MSHSVLLVGFGRRGRQWHQAASSRRGCRVVGAVDGDERARAEARAQRLSTWETLEEALAAADARTVIIATPPQLHAAQTLSCVRAGRAVLVEKPLALSLKDATAVAQAAEANGVPVVVGHNFRHRAQERTIRRGLARADVGDLRIAAVVTARPAFAPRYQLPEYAPLWDLGIHHLDLLRVRAGVAPDSIEARCASSKAGVTFRLNLEWDGGRGADYWLREGGAVYHHAEWLEGEHGALRVSDGRVWVVTPNSRPRRLRATRGPDAKQVLLDAVLDGAASGVDARDAQTTIAMVEAAIRSLRLERPVRLAELAVTTAAQAR